MAALNVKPTRMELSNLKKKRKVAVRGHKLMKDKRDEMVRRFIVYVRRNRTLREEVEQKLASAMQGFVLARASMRAEAVEEALCYPARPAEIKVSAQHVLSVVVPKLELASVGKVELPYGIVGTSELAEVEKTCNRLADEIEKTRRRVNALEYVMIPQFDEAIRTIKMKLDENERGNLTRLMKTKEMLAQKE